MNNAIVEVECQFIRKTQAQADVVHFAHREANVEQCLLVDQLRVALVLLRLHTSLFSQLPAYLFFDLPFLLRDRYRPIGECRLTNLGALNDGFDRIEYVIRRKPGILAGRLVSHLRPFDMSVLKKPLRWSDCAAVWPACLHLSVSLPAAL